MQGDVFQAVDKNFLTVTIVPFAIHLLEERGEKPDEVNDISRAGKVLEKLSPSIIGCLCGN